MTYQNNDEVLYKIDHVVKNYGNNISIKVLQGISFTVFYGEFIAITGPSGSGKTTLLNLLGTLDAPTSGKIYFKEKSLTSLKNNELTDFRRQNIGFVFQLFHLLPELSALENVMIPLLPWKKNLSFNLKDRAHEILKAVGLENRLSHLPGQLSGGEQQRVAIARSLINQPQVLLADEPTGNLDTKSSNEIILLLKNINIQQKLTLVIVTHNMEVAKQADRIINIRDGIVEEETKKRADLLVGPH